MQKIRMWGSGINGKMNIHEKFPKIAFYCQKQRVTRQTGILVRRSRTVRESGVPVVLCGQVQVQGPGAQMEGAPTQEPLPQLQEPEHLLVANASGVQGGSGSMTKDHTLGWPQIRTAIDWLLPSIPLRKQNQKFPLHLLISFKKYVASKYFYFAQNS